MIVRALIISSALYITFSYITSWDNKSLPHALGDNLPQNLEQNTEILTTNHEEIFEMLFSNCTDLNETSSGILDDCSLCACATETFRISFPLSTECEVTEEIVQRLMALLQRAWEIITIPGEAGNSLKIFNSSDICASMIPNKQKRKSFSYLSPNKISATMTQSCDDLLADMEELIVALTEQIRLLVLSLDDPAFLWPRIAQLQSCIGCLNRKMSDLEQEYGQQLGNITQQLIDMKDCFTLEVRRRAEQISQLEERLDAKSFQVISANVNASNYTSAVVEFNRLKNPGLLTNLISELYSSQKIENILTFGMLLNFNNAERRAIMYEQIQDLMKNDPSSRDIHQVVLYKTIADDTKFVCNIPQIDWCDDLPNRYFNLIVKAVQDIDQLVLNWGASIRQGGDNHRNLWVIASPDDRVTLAGDAFHDILGRIVTKSLDQNISRNLKNTLDFVSGLRWNKQKLEGFKVLLDLVKGNAHATMRVAADMKIAMETLKGPDGRVEEVKDGFLDLKKDLPQHVRHLVWGSICNIKRSGDNRCLWCGNGMEAYNSGVSFSSDCNSQSSKWVLVPTKIGHENDEILFKFQNAASSAYFGVHTLWKHSGGSWGVTACSTQDFGEYPDKHYLWSLRLSSSPPMLALVHVGRKGYLLTGDTPEIYLASNSNPYNMQVTCTGVD